jgi:L-amino acid N-acyltransferase YncA
MTAPEISDADPGVVVALPDVRKRRRPTATRKRCAKAPRPLPLLRLRDGASILVRPVTSGDREVIADAYNGLSDQTRYRRFQSTAPHLLPRDLDRLTQVDHRSHEALVAIEPGTGRLIGVARYIALPGSVGDAEVAALVVDDWQRRGVGMLLMRALSERARANGVRRFIAIVHVENRPVIDMLKRVGATYVRGDGTLTFAIAARVLIVHDDAAFVGPYLDG